MYRESSCFRILVFIYSVTFCFLLVAASVTAYVLSHPELGLKERNPIVRDYVSQYGLELGLLLVNLYNFGTIFVSWLLFLSYLALSRKYEWKQTLADSVVYGMMSAYGLYMLISWLLNAANDVSCLLFRSDPHGISALWESWDSLSRHVTLAIFLVLFSIVHYSTRRKQRVTRAARMNSRFEQKRREGKVRCTHYLSFLCLTRLMQIAVAAVATTIVEPKPM